jgi:hypothetical protein
MTNHSIQRGGFTLLELVIYMALSFLVLGGLLLTTYVVIDGSANIQNKAIVNDEGMFLTRKLDWALSGASAVSAPDPTILNITKPSLPAGENPLVFTFTNGNVLFSRGSAGPKPLNGANVSVSSTMVAYDADTKTARAVFTVTYLSASRTFETTRYIRP